MLKYTSTNPCRVACYSRVSTDTQREDGISILQQPEMLKEALDRKYGRGNYVIVEELADAGLSSKLGPTTTDMQPRKYRPGLKRLFELAQGGKIDCVATYSLSRLYRDSLATLGFAVYLKERNVELFSTKEDFDINDPSGKFMLAILGAVNGLERDRNNQVVKDHLRKRKEKGHWIGAVPYGWRNSTAVEAEAIGYKAILPIPHQLAVVKKMADLYLSGFSAKKIARLMEESGEPPVQRYIIPGYRARWTPGNVMNHLTNCAHAGFVKLADGRLVEGKHFAHRAYDPDIYHRIFATMNDRRKKFRGQKIESSTPMLGGLGVCGGCGSKLHIRRTYSEARYHCNGWKGNAKTQHVSVLAQTLEKAVLHHIAFLAQRPEVLAEAEARIGKELNADQQAQRILLGNFKSEHQKLEEKRKKALKDYQDGFLEARDLADVRTGLNELEANLDAQISELERTLTGTFTSEELERRAFEALRNFDTCWNVMEPEEQRQLLISTIEKLEIHDDDTIPLMILKVRLMPEYRLHLPRIIGARGIAPKSGIESLTARELACLWHLREGRTPLEMAGIFDITVGAVCTTLQRARERLNCKTNKLAAQAASAHLDKVQHLLQLHGRTPIQSNVKRALTVMEWCTLESHLKGMSYEEMSERYGISVERLQSMMQKALKKAGTDAAKKAPDLIKSQDLLPRGFRRAA